MIRGRVLSYYHKQLAQEAVRGLFGVEMILNAVEVHVNNGLAMPANAGDQHSPSGCASTEN